MGDDDGWSWPSQTPQRSLSPPPARRTVVEGEEKERVTAIAEELRSYTMDIADPDFLAEANELLAAELPSLAATIGYYAARPELARYTLDKELPRLAYVVTSQQRAQQDAPRIRGLYPATSAPALSDAARGGLMRRDAQEVLWRMANQSAFADALQLVSDFGLVRSELATGVRATSCSFRLDLDDVGLEAEAELVVSVAGGAADTDGRLELARLTLGLSCVPPIMLSEPQRAGGHLRFEVRDARPSLLFDDALRRAAKHIAEDRAALEACELPKASLSDRLVSAIDAELDEPEEPTVGGGWLDSLVSGFGRVVGAERDEPVRLYRED